jgi:hypothetical protein
MVPIHLARGLAAGRPQELPAALALRASGPLAI